MLPGYHKPYRLDISDRKWGLLVYIKSHLLSKLLKTFDIPSNIQIIPFELNLRKEKWMFMCIYRPPSQNKQYFLEKLSEIIDHFSSIYDNYIILGDFNMEPSDSILKTFMQSHNLFNLIKSNTCFKRSVSCIYLIVTYQKFCFKNSSKFETGLSDHHHLIYSMLKTTFKKEEPKRRIYCYYKNFSNEYFKSDLKNGLSKCPKNYESFEDVFLTVLDRHATWSCSQIKQREKNWLFLKFRNIEKL